nr:hypothetical protein [Variovorax boronicumulans]
MADIVPGGFDAGVRFPEALPQGMVAVPVGPMQRFCVVARPWRRRWRTGARQSPAFTCTTRAGAR